jgi:hypothetical protein
MQLTYYLRRKLIMKKNLSGLSVPVLAHDVMMQKEFGTVVSTNGKLERRIVWALCQNLKARGWSVHTVWDGEELTRVSTPKEAMELIFNLDEASLRFTKDGKKLHGVLLILGNGEDIISDWNYSVADADGFDADMVAVTALEVA